MELLAAKPGFSGAHQFPATLLSENMQIPESSITLDSSSRQNRLLATYKLPSRVGQVESASMLVEWRHFSNDMGESTRLTQLSRIEGLARLLRVGSKPKGLRVPHCLGYIVDDWHPRVGFIFEYSSSDSSSPTSPRSLWQSFETLSMPYLGDRFRLALDLSLTLSLLHTSGWLHKAFRSENVVFYPRPNESREDATSIHHPNILGFEHSRPNNPNAFTDLLITDDHVSNLYRHPKGYRPGGERFSQDFDIYSLGIVLLEIGYWRRISEFWHEGHTRETF
jgi:hypothetical protein